MDGIVETLKTTGAGMGGWWLSVSGILSDVVSIGVALATLVYLVVKIIKEVRSM